MAFNIYVKGIDAPPVYEPDIEKCFSMLTLTGDDVEKKFLYDIDGASFYDDTLFFIKDRYDCKISVWNLSTGCKAALVVYHNPDKAFNCVEAGDNAIAAILKYCEYGNIIIANTAYLLKFNEAIDRSIKYLDYKFESLQDFAEYMRVRWANKPSDDIINKDTSIVIDKYNFKIRVHLDHGVFVFTRQSGIGKTYLANILNNYFTFGERVFSYTYSDFCKGINLDEILGCGRFDLILLDRYDMYYGEAIESIEEFGKRGVVLVDCKQVPPFACERCMLYYFVNAIEIRSCGAGECQ